MTELSDREKLYFRDLLREARSAAQKNAEGFMSVVQSLEMIGTRLSNHTSALAQYKDTIGQIAQASPLANELPRVASTWHAGFSVLYEELRVARNDAVHQGAFARLLTSHALQLALILEDALMDDAIAVSQFMVRQPVCAEPWQPVSFVRQQMLSNAFSYLPLYKDDRWKLVPEYSVARYLRTSANQRKTRLATSLQDAEASGELSLLPASTVRPDEALAGSRFSNRTGVE